MPRSLEQICSLIVILLKSMACFFRCFGVRCADRRHVVSSSDSAIATPVDPVASMNQKASSLFPSEETETVAVKEGDSHLDRADDWELRDEAKFLKSCGTLQDTPDEIRKLPKKLKDSVGEPNSSNSSLLENYNVSGQLPAPVRLDEENTAEPAAVDSPTPCRGKKLA